MPTPTPKEASPAFNPATGMTNLEYATLDLLGKLVLATPKFTNGEKLDPHMAMELCRRAIKGAHIMFDALEKDAEE